MLNLDPQDTDEFFTIKGEIDKLSGTDYPLVISLCEKLLNTVGKDTRIAGYLTFAKLQTSGVMGFCEGLDGYTQLLTEHGGTLFPQRINAKLSSIQWLNQPKVKDNLKNKLSEDHDELTQLIKSIENFNQQLIRAHQEAPEILTSMIALIKTKLQAFTKPVELIPIELITASNDPIPEVSIIEKPMVCDSKESLEHLSLLQIKYCLEQKRLEQAVYYARALRLNTELLDEILKTLLSCEAERLLGMSEKEIKQGIEKIIFYKKADSKKDSKAITPMDYINQYRGIVAGKSFEEKIIFLSSDFKSHEDFLKGLAIVRFCMEDRQLELAWYILKKLSRWIEDLCLYSWDPELSLFTWEEVCSVLTLIYDDFSEDEKNDARKIWSASFQKMCEINLVRAMKVKRNFK
jgi:hypothetical protein